MGRKILLPIFIFSFSLAGNILPNPSFEIWLDTLGINLPLGWLTSEIIRESSAVKSTFAHTGEFSVNLIGRDTVAFITTTTIVSPGKSYLFSGWARTQNPLPGSFTLQFLNLLGNPIGNPTILPVYFSTNYREYRTWVTAPESAFFLICALITFPNTNTFVDDVTLDDTSFQLIAERKNRAIPSSPFSFHLSYPQRVEIRIYNLLGEEIRRIDLGVLSPGFHQFFWDKRDKNGRIVRKGLYFVKIATQEKNWVKKFLIF